MSKVIFSIQYELSAGRKDEYIGTIRELKTLLQAEGLEDYSVFEVKGKPNHFQEQYKFISDEAFEEFDDNNDERINILINKINDLAVEHSTKYTTLKELV
ncbi:MAG: hypothetical protein HKM87_00930 [Ignavibacteriaceae bacterium]|nr:hypothetical protein [Ignavibacteriaceae bacterium]